MNKIIIFCESYGQIPFVLQTLQKYSINHDITLVIPGFQDLFNALQIINDNVFHGALKLVHVEAFQPARAKTPGFKKLLTLIPDIITEKRYLKTTLCRYFAETRDVEVFFFSEGFIGLKIYLLQKLAKANRLVFFRLPLSQTRMSQSFPQNLREFVNLILWKFLYGNAATIGTLPQFRGFLFTTDKFMKQNIQRYIDPPEINEMMKNYDLNLYKIYDTGSYDVIYFDDGFTSTGYLADVGVFQKELAVVFDILVRYFPKEKIAYKYHPGYTGDKTIIKTGKMIPSFIPAELLNTDYTKLHLSIFSYSIAHVQSGLAVSLANFVTFKDNKTKEKFKEGLVLESKPKVLFPQSLDEFERIVVELVNTEKKI